MGLLYDVLKTLRADTEWQEQNTRQLLQQLTDSAGRTPEENEKKHPDTPEERERSGL